MGVCTCFTAKRLFGATTSTGKIFEKSSISVFKESFGGKTGHYIILP